MHPIASAFLTRRVAEAYRKKPPRWGAIRGIVCGMRLITAADVMNPRVLTVRADMTVQEAARFLVDHEITGAPVQDREGRLVGVISVVDIAEAASAGTRLPRPTYFSRGGERPLSPGELDELASGEIQVADIMTPEIYSVAEDTPVSEVALRMLKDHLHRLLVVSGDQPVGVVSTSDLLGLLVDVE